MFARRGSFSSSRRVKADAMASRALDSTHQRALGGGDFPRKRVWSVGRSFSQRVRRVTDFGFTRETGRRFYFFYIIGGDRGRPGGGGGVSEMNE